MSVSREARLERYAQLLRQWNPVINLVSPATIDDLETRHIDDCVQLAEIAPADRLSWIDIGSGGGLPGLVIAIADPERPVLLVDSDRRKVTFIQTVIRELGLTHCRAMSSRIESLDPAGVRHLSARALAPLDRLMPYLSRHLASDGTAWLMKGRNWRSELASVDGLNDFEVTIHPSLTDPEAAILQLDRKPRV